MVHVAENQKSCSTRRSFDIGTYDVHRGGTMALVRYLFVPIVIGRIIVSKMLKMGGAARVVSLFSA